MSLINLLSTHNYCSFNVNLANIVGLEQAIYISEVMNINDKAIRKNKLDEKYFVLDRKYLQERTTFDEKKQLEIEERLLNLGILEKGKNKNSLNLNITTITSLLMNDTDKLKIDIKKIIKPKSDKKTKSEGIRENLKKNIKTTNEELKIAYGEWIDAVHTKLGWMSAKTVTLAEKTVDDFADHNLDIALQIIDIATANGYRDMQWAINKYKENYTLNIKKQNNYKKEVKVNKEVVY